MKDNVSATSTCASYDTILTSQQHFRLENRLKWLMVIYTNGIPSCDLTASLVAALTFLRIAFMPTHLMRRRILRQDATNTHKGHEN